MNKKEKRENIRNTILGIFAIILGAVIFYEFVLPFFTTNRYKTNYCSQTFNCVCAENSKTCSCRYYDKNNKEDSIICPNNNLITTNGTR